MKVGQESVPPSEAQGEGGFYGRPDLSPPWAKSYIRPCIYVYSSAFALGMHFFFCTYVVDENHFKKFAIASILPIVSQLPQTTALSVPIPFFSNL